MVTILSAHCEVCAAQHGGWWPSASSTKRWLQMLPTNDDVSPWPQSCELAFIEQDWRCGGFRGAGTPCDGRIVFALAGVSQEAAEVGS